MIIFLIGFMGSGKSTTGRRLSSKLGYDFVDTDEVIIDRYGLSINEIFFQIGEEKFRESETLLLNELIQKESLVVSTGGGMPCHSENMELINANGCSIYLKLSPQALFSRLSPGKHKRPLIKNLNDEELMSFVEETLLEREPLYSKAKHVVGFDTDLEELLALVQT